MASGRFLLDLDTNIVIALLAEDPAVRRRVSEAAEVFASSIVLGELYYGARKSTRIESNVETVDKFAAANRVLGCDSTTAQHYGEIKNVLREKGRPIPENDIWIAATAKQHDLTVASRDNHFDCIGGLSTEQVLDLNCMLSFESRMAPAVLGFDPDSGTVFLDYVGRSVHW